MDNNCSNQNEFNKEGRIFFVYPPSCLLEKFPPIDLMYLASVAKKLDFSSKIKCFASSDLLEEIDEYNPHFLLANITTPTFKNDMEALSQIKLQFPFIKIIVMGDPFLTYNTNVIYENYFVDYVIMGEPELTFQEILSGVADKDILGICYRENEQGVKNELRPYNDNLDELPFPDRDLVDNSFYKSIITGHSQSVIEISRGCPHNCFFCLQPSICGMKPRFRSADSIILEIKECIEKYNITDFFFKSDVFNIDKTWANSFCQKIVENGLKITWSTNILTESFDEELASNMYKSGCRLVYIGVESGSRDILNNIGKKSSPESIRNTVNILKKYKIKIHASFIFGLPWETEKTAQETIDFALELNSDYADFNISAPIPGTRHFAYMMINKLVDSDLTFENAYKTPVVRSHELSKERILELKFEAERRFAKRNGFIKFLRRLFYR